MEFRTETFFMAVIALGYEQMLDHNDCGLSDLE